MKLLSTLGSLGAVALLATTGMVGTTLAQTPASPVGQTWDCVLSGSRQSGIAFISFNDDFSFQGFEILVPTKKAGQSGIDPRGGSGIGRYDETTTNSVSTVTNLFGFEALEGRWAYDYRGRLVGNSVNNRVTNYFSFSGIVVPGKRLTLTASTSVGKVTYRGIPSRQVPSLAGEWQAIRRQKPALFNEFFTLTSVAESNPFPDEFDFSPFPNLYYTQDGQGPGYDLMGFAMISAQKKIAFAFNSYNSGDTNAILSATIGSYSSSKGLLKANTTGTQENIKAISYTATHPLLLPAVR